LRFFTFLMLNFGGEPMIRRLFYTMGSSRSCFGQPL
jgi:hypothetical protein